MKRKLAMLMTIIMMAVTLSEAYVPVRAEEETVVAEEDPSSAGLQPAEDEESVVTAEEAGGYTESLRSVRAGSNAVKLTAGSTTDSNYDLYMIVSEEEGVGGPANEDVLASLSEKETAIYRTHSRFFRNNGSAGYTGIHIFEGFKPSTKYYYRLAKKSGGYYSYVSEEGSFTTAAVVSETAVGTELKVTEAGYGAAELELAVDEPDNEVVTDVRISCGEGTVQSASWSSAGDEQKEYYSCTVVFGKEKELSVTPEYKLYINGEAVWKKAEPQTLTATALKSENVKLDAAEGVGSFRVLIRPDPAYGVDDGYWKSPQRLYMNLYYKEAEALGWSVSSVSYKQKEFSASLEGLTAGTEYDYHITVSGDSEGENVLWSYGSEDVPLQFTPLAEADIDEEELFPDEAFLALVKKAAGKESGELKLSDLEKITALNDTADKDTPKYIKNIKGAERLVNLASLTLEGHDISDISPIKDLKRLKTIKLKENNISSLPDLSGLISAGNIDLSNNLIPQEEFVTEHFPAGYGLFDILSMKSSQRKAVSAVYAKDNTYYAIGSTHPFIVAFNGLRTTKRNYSASVKMADGPELELSNTDIGWNYTEYVCVRADMGEQATGVKTVEVRLKENGTTIYEDTITADFTADVDTAVETEVLYGRSKAHIEFTANGLSNAGLIEKLAVVDAEGKEVQADINISGIVLNSETAEYRYRPVFNRYSVSDLLDLKRDCTTVTTDLEFRTKPDPGEYSLVMTRADREGEICAAKIKITDTPYISALNRVDGLDNRGEYQYFDARGLNLREDIYPDIYKNGVRVAEFVEAFGAPGRPEHLPDTHMIYRYRKLFRDEAWTTNAALSVDGGGKIIFEAYGGWSSKSEAGFYPLDSTILTAYSDYRKDPGNLAVAFADTAGYSDGETVKLSVEDKYTGGELASSSAVISKGFAVFALRRTDGSSFELADGEQYTLKFIHGRTEIEYDYTDKKYNKPDAEQKAGVRLLCDHVSVNGNELEVRLFVSDSELKHGDLRLSFKGQEITPVHDDDAQASDERGGKIYKGSFALDAPLNEGRYELTWKHDNTKLEFANVGESLALDSQEAEYVSTDGKAVTVAVEVGAPRICYERSAGIFKESAEKYFESRKLAVTFTDIFGNAIDAEAAGVQWSDAGLKAYYRLPGEYASFWACVTADGQILKRYASSAEFYPNNEYQLRGKLHEPKRMVRYAAEESAQDVDGLTEYTGIKLQGTVTFPVTGKFLRPGSGEVISSFSFDGWYHKFGKSDIKALAADEVYTLALNDACGYSDQITGYFVKDGNNAPSPGPDPDAEPELSGISFEKAELQMDMGEELKLVCKAEPEGVQLPKLVWKVSDSSKVRVDAGGKLTAYKPTYGKYVTVTASTEDGKYACECKVTVSMRSYDDTDEQTRISLEDIDSYVIPDKVNKVFGNVEVKLGKKKGKVTVASLSVNHVNAITYNGRAIKDQALLDIGFDATPVLKAAGIELKAEDIVSVNYVFKNNKNATAGVTKDSKKSYFYVKLKIYKGAKKLINDKAKYNVLRKIVAEVNKQLKAKDNRCFFTINKASMVDVHAKVYMKNAKVALDKKGNVKGLKKVTVKFEGDKKETKLSKSMYDKKDLKPDVTANTLRVKGLKNFTGSIVVKADTRKARQVAP